MYSFLTANLFCAEDRDTEAATTDKAVKTDCVGKEEVVRRNWRAKGSFPYHFEFIFFNNIFNPSTDFKDEIYSFLPREEVFLS